MASAEPVTAISITRISTRGLLRLLGGRVNHQRYVRGPILARLELGPASRSELVDWVFGQNTPMNDPHGVIATAICRLRQDGYEIRCERGRFYEKIGGHGVPPRLIKDKVISKKTPPSYGVPPEKRQRAIELLETGMVSTGVMLSRELGISRWAAACMLRDLRQNGNLKDNPRFATSRLAPEKRERMLQVIESGSKLSINQLALRAGVNWRTAYRILNLKNGRQPVMAPPKFREEKAAAGIAATG